MIRGKYLGLVVGLFILPFIAFSQPVKTVNDTLFDYFQALRTTQEFNQKMVINEKIKNVFRRILSQDKYYEHSFDTIKSMGVVSSPDEAFRIINWNTMDGDGTYTYHAFIQYRPKKRDEIKLTELIDHSDSIIMPEQQILPPDQWYGALYYEIVPAKINKQMQYVLLGWDGGDIYINRKVIDVLTFSSSGKPKFGKNVFKFGKKRKKRVIFEFSYQATMRLFYDDNIDMIVFEHMTPIRPSLKDQKMQYGSDLTFDGLELVDDKWILRENLDVKNDKKSLRRK
ncbi:MAG: hypothetical protein C0599_15385 [Salinivirgaceae bacterium]|nr:MAG: hypothetical protein C0599_15385 [Salinivirgaceae bacterium]